MRFSPSRPFCVIAHGRKTFISALCHGHRDVCVGAAGGLWHAEDLRGHCGKQAPLERELLFHSGAAS